MRHETSIKNGAAVFPPENFPPTLGEAQQALVRTRTGDPFLTMEVLYQLSYEGVAGEGIAPLRPA